MNNEMISAGCVLTDLNNNIYLQKRDQNKNIYFPGQWGLFGGSCEKDESPEDAIKREIFEELTIKIISPKKFLILKITTKYLGTKSRIRHFYHQKLNSTILSNIELREGETYNSFSFDKLPSLNKLVPFDAAAISIFGLSQISRKQIIPFL